MDVSIVIVNWNSAEYTRQCIASIRENTKATSHEIIVVDNASTDDSLVYLETIEGIQLIRSQQNIGFARANNVGVEASSGNILLFLNPDTELAGPAIDKMFEALQMSDCAALGCKLLNTDRTLQTSCIQPFPTIWNQITDIEKLKLMFPHVRMWGIAPLFTEVREYPVPVEALSGACIMIRSEVFQQVGQFSTDYFMYAEDIDLCYKIQQSGKKVGYIPDATIIHFGGQSTKKRSDTGFGDIATREAIFTFLRKFRGTAYAKIYRAALGIVSALRVALLKIFLLFTFNRDSREYLTFTARKWLKILRWSMGLENWTERLTPQKPHRIGESES
ncbi:MAG TPA: glycosyltransferase family 2 protein [Terracidiphilus sp.]|jgi:GT2 family glycosyltransferase|nr:glycosyltransferase family 2 protein [Terracidiphilus sp.]